MSHNPSEGEPEMAEPTTEHAPLVISTSSSPFPVVPTSWSSTIVATCPRVSKRAAIFMLVRSGCKGCVFARGRPSSCCVRRGRSKLPSRPAGLRNLVVLVGIVCFVVGFSGSLLYGGSARTRQTSRSCVDRRQRPSSETRAVPILQERIRENHGVSKSSGGDGYGDMVLRDSRWRRVSTRPRVPANNCHAALQSDGMAAKPENDVGRYPARWYSQRKVGVITGKTSKGAYKIGVILKNR